MKLSLPNINYIVTYSYGPVLARYFQEAVQTIANEKSVSPSLTDDSASVECIQQCFG